MESLKPQRWTFEVGGLPVPKERPKGGRAGNLTKAQKAQKAAAKRNGEDWSDPRGIVFRTPDRTTSFERQVAAAAQEAGLRAGAGPCEVALRVWLPVEANRMDLDNIAKSVLDGLVLAGKAALVDDSVRHVRRIVAEFGGIDGVNPRTLIRVRLLPEDGILRRLLRSTVRIIDKLPGGFLERFAPELLPDDDE